MAASGWGPLGFPVALAGQADEKGAVWSYCGVPEADKLHLRPFIGCCSVMCVRVVFLNKPTYKFT